MEIAEFILDKMGSAFWYVIIGMAAWYYFVLPGVERLRKASKKEEDKDS